ncbi:MAG: DUF1573 domain-containing protein [Gemmataceae bacterium]|nr:DUF1573 domain-containing protein [Gemmataceae bacterium]
MSDFPVEATDLDFGEVWEDSEFERSIPVYNPGDTGVEVERWLVSCNCTGVRPETLRIGPGESKTVVVRIDLGSMVDPVSPRPVPASVGVVPVVGGRHGPTWTLRGTVKPVTAGRLPNLSETLSDIEPRPAVRRIVLPLAAAVTDATVTTDTSGVRCESVFAADTQSLALTLSFDPPVAVGPTDYLLTVRGRLAADGTAFRKFVRGRVTVIPDLRASPPRVAVVGLSDGEVREEVVSFESVSGRPFTLLGADPDGEGVEARLLPGNQLALLVRRPVGTDAAIRRTVAARIRVGSAVQRVSVDVTIAP